MKNKEIYTPGLILGILSIVFMFFSTIIGCILGIIGINLNVKNKKNNKTKLGLILSIIGLSLNINKLLIIIALIIVSLL